MGWTTKKARRMHSEDPRSSRTPRSELANSHLLYFLQFRRLKTCSPQIIFDCLVTDFCYAHDLKIYLSGNRNNFKSLFPVLLQFLTTSSWKSAIDITLIIFSQIINYKYIVWIKNNIYYVTSTSTAIIRIELCSFKVTEINISICFMRVRL